MISGISNSQIALINFKKGTKTNLSAYLIFKSEKYCDTFHHSFHATARAQGLGDILNPKFHPKYSNTSTQLLFSEQQPFMYSVLVVTLQTERGKELTKEFEDDTQQILAQLHEYHTKSEMAQHETVELTTYITNLRLTDTWKAATQQFLTYFKKKLCLLDSLVEESDKIPETTCIVFLQQAVKSIPDLCQVHVMDTVWRLASKRLVLSAHSATKAVMTCSKVLPTTTVLWSTQL